jgi:putative DNA primase/helicase
MIDVERVKQEASGRWFGILDNLGIDVRHDNKHGPCPLCPGGKDRFRMDIDGSRYYCNQCGHGDTIALIQKYMGITFIEAVEKISHLIGIIEMDFKPNKPKKDPSIYLNKIWKSSFELSRDDPVLKYLQSRGITFMPDDVRYCPSCWESDTKQNLHAMVARITNKGGKPIGLHVAYLKDGRKADIPSPKKMLPATESLEGSAIRLSPICESMGIAEGIETALSCTKLFDIPTWACMSAGLMEKWFPPEGCKNVVIFADNDYNFTGLKSAYILANKLYLKGFKVQVQIPPKVGDWNDVLMKGNL